MRILNINLAHRSYPIFIETQSLSDCGKEILHYCPAKRFIILTDDNVAIHYAAPLINSLKQLDVECHSYQITPGEESKSLPAVEQIYIWMLTQHFHRDDVIIALGGGVVGDLAGFIAATYLRGVRWVQIPTTLMAQVDSSVGGKVGINHPLAKNCIGAFYQPLIVWIDPVTLKTLPKREIFNGIVEVIKYGLILDRDLFEFLENNFINIVALENPELLVHIIRTCCTLKAMVVEKDERESHYRRILNFGHTVGHALERITGYHYFKHGEAVAWGMLPALAISERKASFANPQMQRVLKMINQIEKPVVPPDISDEQLRLAIENDKKMTAEGLHFVLLEEIGKCRIDLVNKELIEYGINKMLTYTR